MPRVFRPRDTTAFFPPYEQASPLPSCFSPWLSRAPSCYPRLSTRESGVNNADYPPGNCFIDRAVPLEEQSRKRVAPFPRLTSDLSPDLIPLTLHRFTSRFAEGEDSKSKFPQRVRATSREREETREKFAKDGSGAIEIIAPWFPSRMLKYFYHSLYCYLNIHPRTKVLGTTFASKLEILNSDSESIKSLFH